VSARRWAPLVLVVALLAGCAGIPTSGPVKDGDAQVDQPGGVVALPEGPQPGASARTIVEGFMLAGSAGLSGDFQVARQFLTGDASSSWDPSTGTTVSSETVLTQTSDQQITATLEVVGKVDSDGRFAAAAGARESVTFDLAKVDGQWRVIDPPDGLIVSARVFEQQYRAAPLYFLTPDRSQLVPDVRYYPARNLATSVIQGLLAGPSPWLRDAVSTAVPDGVELKPEAVLVDAQGTAQVVLQPAQAVQTATQRGLLLAQITHSLDLPGISKVEVRAGPNGVLLDGATAFADPPVGTAVMVSGDALVQLSGSTVTPVSGVGSLAGLDSVATDESGTVRVALAGGGRLVRLPTGDAAAVTIATAATLAAPSVDRFGWVWTASEVTGAGLIAVGPKNQTVPVTADWLSGRVVTAVRVSRDGTRVAVVSTGANGQSVDVAGVIRDKSGSPASLGESVQVGAGLAGADRVVWEDASTLLVLGGSGGAASLTLVPVAGPSEQLPAVSDAVAVAADYGERTMLVATSGGQLRRYSGRTWVEIGGLTGLRDPTFAG
jgi:hypothetical protein